MSEPDVVPTSPEGWGGLLAALLVAWVSAKKILERIGVIEPKVDVQRIAEAVARAVMAEKDESDREHREAIIAALGKVDASIHSVNAATSANIRAALELYGKDVSRIQSAQERVERQLDGLVANVADLRVEVAAR